MRNLNLNSILLFILISITIVKAEQFTPLQQVCNFYANQQNRFGKEYTPDVSLQRCSFCQYSQSGSTFTSGCQDCPDYQTGQCKYCLNSYVQTNQNICIPCPDGSTCCVGNIASSDPNYQATVKSIQNNSITVSQIIYEALIKYTGLRQMTCLQGYFQIGHVCQKNPEGCDQVLVKDNYYFCQQCQPGYFLDSNNVCSQECSAYYNYQNSAESGVQKCASCSSPTRCTACSNLYGYFYLELFSSSSETVNDPLNSTLNTIQVCSQCPLNCIDCSDGSDSCRRCANYYFFSGKACEVCPTPTNFIVVNTDLKIEQLYTGCINGLNMVTSYIFTPYIQQTDSLGQLSPRPIIQLENGKYTACDSNCIKCSSSPKNTTVCQECLKGYYLDPNGQTPQCIQCPDKNSIICTYNTTIKKPVIQVCKVNLLDLIPPYSKTYYLQLDFNSFFITGGNVDKYDPFNQCILNENNCREMIKDDLTKIGLCQSCYSDTSFFAADLSNTPPTTYMMTIGQTCRACNMPGAAQCIQDPVKPTEIIIQSCKSGYQSNPVNGICQQCKLGCISCNNDGTCLECDTTLYFTVQDKHKNIIDCVIAYDQEQNPSLIQGCVDWGEDSSFTANPSCFECQSGYALIQDVNVLVSSSKNFTANLCMACPVNCTLCSQGNRSYCLSCAPGYYLYNGNCWSIPMGCATFNGKQCTYCQYGYRLINNQWCSLCSSKNGVSFSQGQWFDCPGAQCASGSSDEPDGTSSITLQFSYLLIIIITFLV